MLEWVGRCVAPPVEAWINVNRALAGTHRRDRPFLNFNLACFLFREQESAPPYTCQREIKNCSARLAEVTAVKSIQYRAVCFHEIYTVAPVVASVVLTFTHSIGPGPYTCTGRLGPCG